MASRILPVLLDLNPLESHLVQLVKSGILNSNFAIATIQQTNLEASDDSFFVFAPRTVCINRIAAMSIPAGSACFVCGAPPCVGIGVSLNEKELDAAMNGAIAAACFDDEGISELQSLLAVVAETEFAVETLAEVLAGPDHFEDWRVGEAIAEAYLQEHRSCHFPWPDSRDVRKEGSSLPGADLVGFQVDTQGERFAFGEVKTSSENKYPPGAMHGRHGLKQQLEDLLSQRLRHKLITYLGFRAKGASWEARYQNASRRYLENPSSVHLFGILIRDVSPNPEDISTRVKKLADNCPNEMHIEILAIYLPGGKISKLGIMLSSKQTGGDA